MRSLLRVLSCAAVLFRLPEPPRRRSIDPRGEAATPVRFLVRTHTTTIANLDRPIGFSITPDGTELITPRRRPGAAYLPATSAITIFRG